MADYSLPSTSSVANILVVDDDQMMVELLSEWVNEKWECETAIGGESALNLFDESFDVVLLDRQMPDVSGEKVLEEIRANDTETQVMMVSGVAPDFDILDLPFNKYLQKPVDRPTVQAAIEELLLRRTYHQQVQEFFSAASKIELLEDVKRETELADDERYLSLRLAADERRQQADATLGQVTEHVDQFHDIEADD